LPIGAVVHARETQYARSVRRGGGGGGGGGGGLLSQRIVGDTGLLAVKWIKTFIGYYRIRHTLDSHFISSRLWSRNVAFAGSGNRIRAHRLRTATYLLIDLREGALTRDAM
jgi:hypothetical protein